MNISRTSPILQHGSSEVGTIADKLFGAIANNYFGWDAFIKDINEIELESIRFPGGAIAEDGIVDGRIKLADYQVRLPALSGDRSHIAFDLTHPELISPLALEIDDMNPEVNQVATFSEVLAQAVERDTDVGVVVPVARYYLPEDKFQHSGFSSKEVRDYAISVAKNDISIFLSRLKAGEFNNGIYPSLINLEIGNEQYKYPIEYAVIAKAMIEQIEVEMADSDISYQISLQMARSNQDFDRLEGNQYFRPFEDSTADKIPGLEELNKLISHDDSREEKATKINEVILAALGDSLVSVGGIRHHILGFNSDRFERWYNNMHHNDENREVWLERFDRLDINRDEVEYYVSAWTTDSGNAGGDAYALAAAVNTLQMFSYFAEQGVDRAAVWGIVGDFRLRDSTNDTVISDTRSGVFSPQAAILKLMAQNTKESVLLDTGTNLRFDDARTDDYVFYLYRGETEYTAFFAVEELNGEDLKIEVDLGLTSGAHYVRTTNLDIEYGGMSGQANLSDQIHFPKDGHFAINFDQDYEIVMASIPRMGMASTKSEIPSLGMLDFTELSGLSLDYLLGMSEDEVLSGEGQSSLMFGLGGDDTLYGSLEHLDSTSRLSSAKHFAEIGANGGDIIFGGDGDDQIYGNRGNDWLHGNDGHDQLWGGSGFDTFVFTGGEDIIRDFDYAVDRIVIDADLVEEALGGIGEIWNLVSFGSDHAIIDFGQGDTLRIDSLTSLQQVVDSVEAW